MALCDEILAGIESEAIVGGWRIRLDRWKCSNSAIRVGSTFTQLTPNILRCLCLEYDPHVGCRLTGCSVEYMGRYGDVEAS